VNTVLDFNDFLNNDGITLNERENSPYYHDVLNPVFWTQKKTKSDGISWVFDQRVRRKLIRIAEDFYTKFEDILGDRAIRDIQLTGSLANFNYTDFSDLDVHVLINMDGIDDDNPKILKSAIDGIKFVWNLRHNITIRGYDVELYLQDQHEPHTASALFSLKNNDWIRKPVYNFPEVDDMDVEKKYSAIVSDIEELQTRLITTDILPSNAKTLYNRASKLKSKIQKMRKEELAKGGEMAIGNLVFKKLRNSGYIEKLIDLISKSYDKIYTEK
jgi:ribosomal protein L17